MNSTKIRMWFYASVVVGLSSYVAYATWMPGSSYTDPLPELGSEQLEMRERLREHVNALATKIGARNVGYPKKLIEARNYLKENLEYIASASAPQVTLEELERAAEGAQNIQFDIPGKSGLEIIVVGAHYDSCNESPGANDNGTGVAVALELARAFVFKPAHNTVRIVLFANEEPPFFQRPGMGSRAHAANAKRRADPIRAMVALETMGFYSDRPGSQRYPWPIGLIYPTRGNFLAFVGDLGSRALIHNAIDTFRKTTKFPSEGAALPASFPGVDWSDHWSFRQEGYPAIMVTDTAVYRDPDYHKPTDTPDRLDFDALARVTVGMETVVRYLAR